MTKADITNIKNLVKDLASMKEVAEKMNEVYHDEKIAAFAKAAMQDYKEIQDFLTKTIRENKELFLDFNNLRIDNSGFNDMFCSQYMVVAHITKFFDIAFWLTPPPNMKYWKGNAGGLYAKVTPDCVNIVEVRAYTSDTSLPQYRICSSSSLTKHNAPQYNLDGKYNAETWRYIYFLAKNSQSQTKFLWDSAQEAIKSRIESFRGMANKREQAKADTKNVGVYVKIAL